MQRIFLFPKRTWKKAMECIRGRLDNSMVVPSSCLRDSPYFSSKLKGKVMNREDQDVFHVLLEDAMSERNLCINYVNVKDGYVYILKNK